MFFAASLLPMLVVDDDRRYLDANRAACLLLRSSRERVLQLRIDDLTPLEGRHAVDQLWELFLRDGSQAGTPSSRRNWMWNNVAAVSSIPCFTRS